MNPEDLIWADTPLEQFSMQWFGFESVIPVNPNKEVISVKVELLNKEQTEPAYFDNIELLKNLINDKLLGAEVVYIPVEEIDAATTLQRIVFGATSILKIVRVSYAPEEPIIGNDTDSFQLQLFNPNRGLLLSTASFVAGRDEAANRVFDFGPVNSELAVMEPTETLQLRKINTGNGKKLPRGVLIIQWDLT